MSNSKNFQKRMIKFCLISKLLKIKIFKKRKILITSSLFIFIFLSFYPLLNLTVYGTQFNYYKKAVYNYVVDYSDYLFLTGVVQESRHVPIDLTSKPYLQIHQENILNRVRPNVVFYKTDFVGYGNRIYSMLSAFMISVLTDSALLINWPLIHNHIDCILPYTFYVFRDKSFLDYWQKSPKICNLKTVTINTWAYEKRLDIYESNNIYSRDSKLKHST